MREIGSGNIGATNVLRAGSKPLAAATLVLDAAKGTAAVLFAAHWGETPAILAGLGAFLGHLFPVWLGFRGGKGVATFIGVLLGLYWPAGVTFCAIWLVTAFATRYSSLAALIASAASVVLLAFSARWELAALFLLLTVLLYVRHASNIGRLVKGEEARIGRESLRRTRTSRLQRSGSTAASALAWLRLIRTENVGRPPSQRGLARLRATRQGLFAPQPADLGDLACRGRDRGRRAVRLVDTALFAGEQGTRFSPCAGSPLDALSAGTNNLLKQGESLVTGAADIVDALAPSWGRPPTPRDDLASEDEGMPHLPDIGESERERIVGALGPSPVKGTATAHSARQLSNPLARTYSAASVRVIFSIGWMVSCRI